MKNTCLIYLTHTIYSYKNFLKLQNKLSNILDIFYLFDITDINENDLKIIPENENNILFKGNNIWKKYNGQIDKNHKLYEGNVQFILLEFYKKYNNYDYYWFIEDDIILNGDVYDFLINVKKLNLIFY